MPGLFRALRDEARRWRDERSRGGARHATRRRVREQLGIEDLEGRAVVLAQQLADERNLLRDQLNRTRAQFDRARDDVENLQVRLDEELMGLTAAHRRLKGRIEALEHRQQVWSVMEYLQTADVEEKTLVSVIMATRIAPTITCRAPSPR